MTKHNETLLAVRINGMELQPGYMVGEQGGRRPGLYCEHLQDGIGPDGGRFCRRAADSESLKGFKFDNAQMEEDVKRLGLKLFLCNACNAKLDSAQKITTEIFSRMEDTKRKETTTRNAPPTKPGLYRFRCADCGAEDVMDLEQVDIDDTEIFYDGQMICHACEVAVQAEAAKVARHIDAAAAAGVRVCGLCVRNPRKTS